MTTITLLNNASETSGAFDWPGGDGAFVVNGLLERGLVRLQYLAADGETWLYAGESTRMDSDGVGFFSLPAGKIRALVVPKLIGGVQPSSVYAIAGTIGAALNADANVSRETYGAVTILNKQTSSTGTGFVSFDALSCSALDIINNTGTTLEVRRGSSGPTLQILDGASRLMQGITNANQLQLRRKDVSNAQVTVEAEGYAV